MLAFNVVQGLTARHQHSSCRAAVAKCQTRGYEPITGVLETRLSLTSTANELYGGKYRRSEGGDS